MGCESPGRAGCAPLAGGETLNLDALICDCIQTRLVDILQPEGRTANYHPVRAELYISRACHVL